MCTSVCVFVSVVSIHEQINLFQPRARIPRWFSTPSWTHKTFHLYFVEHFSFNGVFVQLHFMMFSIRWKCRCMRMCAWQMFYGQWRKIIMDGCIYMVSFSLYLQRNQWIKNHFILIWKGEKSEDFIFFFFYLRFDSEIHIIYSLMWRKFSLL